MAVAGYRTRLENSHKTACREVLYRLHPWFGREVFIHAAIDKTDGIEFLRSVDGSGVKRVARDPRMDVCDRSACAPDARFSSIPVVSLQALGALSALLDEVLKNTAPSSNARVPRACQVSHDQNQGETLGAEDDGVSQRGSAQAAPRCTTDGFILRRGSGRRTHLARPAKGCAASAGRPDDAADPGVCADNDEGSRP